MKKADTNVTISPVFQKVFIVAALSVWLVQSALVLFETLGHSGISFGGVWIFQLSIWGLPIVFFLLSLAFLRRKYHGWRLLFWATFLATIGEMLYNGLQTVEEGAFQIYLSHRPDQLSGSFWSGQGSVWVIMAIGTALFVAGLVYMQKRKI